MTNKSNDNSGATTIVGSFRGQFAPCGTWGRPKTASREVPFSEVLKIDEGRQILIVLCSQTQKGAARPTEVLHDRRRRIFSGRAINAEIDFVCVSIGSISA
jgi:hypothetical protein